ncbi:MAG: hypothetical protein NWR20_05890 [Schleiferiaceae bacterium]|nr:hypothetical protein [Schleiferiaceae bacterium]MDP4774267.1 hypothetical protein [Schleiferiaceae bacterium]MDP4855596.1 hypothetical protein [Schleiferiaceae bacterium]
MIPDWNPTTLIALAVAAETLSLLLFGRANTLWRSPGMTTQPQRFLLLRSALALVWVHLGAAILAPGGLAANYPALSLETLPLLALGMLGGLGLLLFALSIRSMPAQLVFFGGSLHLVVGVLVGCFLGETLSISRVVIIGLLLLAQITVLWNDRFSWCQSWGKGSLLPFAVGAIWGTYFPLLGLAINRWGFWPSLIASEWAVMLLMLAWALSRPGCTWRDSSMWRSMTEQSLLSSVGQALSGLALWWGGVILHSILTNFNIVINSFIFRLRFGEALRTRYLLYFALYIAFAAALVFSS